MSAVAVVAVLYAGGTFGCNSPSSPSDTGGGTPTASPSPSTPITGLVSIRDSTYAPDPVHITVRGDVTWTNNGRRRHTTVSDAGLWNSGTLFPPGVEPEMSGDFESASGDTFTWIFTEAGIYPYHCEIHPFKRGTIVVSLDTKPGGTTGK